MAKQPPKSPPAPADLPKADDMVDDLEAAQNELRVTLDALRVADAANAALQKELATCAKVTLELAARDRELETANGTIAALRVELAKAADAPKATSPDQVVAELRKQVEDLTRSLRRHHGFKP